MRKIGCLNTLTLTVIILSGLYWECPAAGIGSITTHMEKGLQYYQSGDYSAALEEFRAATEIDPGYLKAWENMGWSYWKLGEVNQTLEIWENLKEIHPDRSKLLNMIAQAYAAKKDYEKALMTYEESLKAKPGQTEILAAKCRILSWAGRDSEAVIQCQEFLSAHHERDDIRQLLAQLQMSPAITDYPAAIENWQHLIAKRPDELEFQIGLAKTYYRSESYQQAIEIAQRLSELNPKHIPTLEILLDASIRMKDYERAQSVITALQTADPNHPDIITGRAQIHNGRALRFYQQGDYPAALEEFLAAKALVPGLSGLLKNIGWTYQRLGQVNEAIEVWEELTDDHPDDVRMLNVLAQMYADQRRFDEALLTYDRSLKIDPAQKKARFARAKIKRWNGRYQESADELSQLVFEYPEDVSMRHQLALCLTRLQRCDEAIEHFEQLIVDQPDDPQYSMGMARALYLCERYQEALKLVDEVLTKDPNNLDALDFLVDDAVFLHDLQKACRLYESTVTIDSNNVHRLNRLAVCADTFGDYPKVEKAAERSLKLNANQPAVRMLYADSLLINGSIDGAATQYEHILAYNPNNMAALLGLKDCSVAKKDYERAFEYSERVASIDNTNIYLVHAKAMLLAYAGEYNTSIRLLEDQLEELTARDVVLVLLYHGLTKRQRSDIVRCANFRAQMELLLELGYTAVTTKDLIRAWKGESKLPERSVLITFDDARRDSFEHADPVLQDLSLTATMFVPLCTVEMEDPSYCDWQQIKQYADTGRWEMQSHGNRAHRSIIVNTAGEHGPFLTHKQWLDSESRLENDLEYRERIDSDYRGSKDILEDRLNGEVNAYAFPMGNFGQMEYASADAVVNNLTSVKRYYSLSFIQHRCGFNLVGDNPYLLRRREVPETWTAQELRNHIIQNNPVRLVKLNLAKVCDWAGRCNRAIGLYDELLREDPLDKEVLLGKAMAYSNEGRFFEARSILDQIIERDSTHQVALRERERIDQLVAPAVDTFFSFFEDERDRQRLKWGTSVRLPCTDELTITPSWARAELDDKNVRQVNENEFSLNAIYRLGEARCELSYTFRDFFGAEDAHNYAVTAEMPLLVDNVRFTHAYRSEETARAAIQGTRYHENAISIRHAINNRLSSYCRYRHADFTDDNRRNTLKANGLYRFYDQPKFFAGCELALDDADFYSPAYYTPNELKMIQALFRLNGQIFGDLMYNVRYAIGHAWERGVDSQIVQNGSASLGLPISNSLELGLFFNFSDTPTYGSKYVLFNLMYLF